MRSLLAIVGLVACSEAWAQVTLPHDLQPNTKASASKVMENFRALESAIEDIGGCTATQQDNSVLIECADGSSGVLAGTGTVVVIPEGNVTGEAPDISAIPVGDFYWEDGNGVVLSKALGNMGQGGEIVVEGADPYQMLLHQYDATQTVSLFGGTARLVYTQPDCAGTPYSGIGKSMVIRYDGSWWVRGPGSEIDGQQTIIKSYRDTDAYEVYNGQWIVYPCENYPEPRLGTVDHFHVTYDPPAEWLNAAYPLTLVQKP